jgi:hypothetical protein
MLTNIVGGRVDQTRYNMRVAVVLSDASDEMAPQGSRQDCSRR